MQTVIITAPRPPPHTACTQQLKDDITFPLFRNKIQTHTRLPNDTRENIIQLWGSFLVLPTPDTEGGCFQVTGMLGCRKLER